MVQAFVITLREGLEAFLIVAISLAYLRKSGRKELIPAVQWGIVLAIAISIGAAYLFHWLQGFFKSADENKRLLAEVHWKTALRMLDSMTYLRGAVMKVGQTLASFPDIAPREFVETLEKLHFDAPPMHWSLLKEMVNSELGDDPENVFASFDKQAFAAASLGQVHGATLKSGEEVAVKIQYPGIARAIESDFRNFLLFLLPSRLSKDWDSTKDQMDDLRMRLAQETDYELEAANLRKARAVFQEEDRIVVPRVFPQWSTGRVLTMERLRGLHLSEWIATGPSQEERNDVGRLLKRQFSHVYSWRPRNHSAVSARPVSRDVRGRQPMRENARSVSAMRMSSTVRSLVGPNVGVRPGAIIPASLSTTSRIEMALPDPSSIVEPSIPGSPAARRYPSMTSST